MDRPEKVNLKIPKPPFIPKTLAQNSKIWALAAELYLSEEILRDIVESITKQRSVGALSKDQACKVIDRLESYKTKRVQKKKAARSVTGNIIIMATSAQRDMIEVMAAQVKWRAEDGFKKFLKVRLGLEQIKTNDDVTKVKKALENMIDHQQNGKA